MSDRLSSSKLLALMTVVAVAGIAAGVVVGSKVISPAQAVADASPPPPSILTVTLENKILSQQTTTRGAVVPGGGLTVTPSPSLASESSVVTKVDKKPGDVVGDGDYFADVSGQPLFLARFDFPLYRDVNLHSVGPDVKQISQFLERNRFLADVTDVADEHFRVGVAKMLTTFGYAALVPVTSTTQADPRQPVTPPPSAPIVYAKWFASTDGDRTISSIGISTGTRIVTDTVLAVLDATPAVIVSYVDKTAAKRIRAGDTAVAFDDQHSQSKALTVANVATQQSTDPSTDSVGTAVTLRPEASTSVSSLTTDIRIVITSAVSEQPALVAPSIAIATDAAGSSTLKIQHTSTMAVSTVDVVLGQCADGYCQITSSAKPLDTETKVVVADASGAAAESGSS